MYSFGEKKDPDVLYEKFFDAETYTEKRDILRMLRPDLTDKMITDFAVTIDHIVKDGSIDERYFSLLSCLDQMAKYESTGLR